MTVIEVNNLNVKYDQTNVLENISFHIEENEFIGIIGLMVVVRQHWSKRYWVC